MKKQSVAVGIARQSKDYILFSKRASSQHCAGFWELPGGKIHFNEDPEDALKREWYEELGVRVTRLSPFIELTHNYSDLQVKLFVFEVDEYEGDVRGCEKQDLAWINPRTLNIEECIPGSRMIVRLLLQSRTLLITPEPYCESEFLHILECSLKQQIRLVRFRQGNLSIQEYTVLAKRVVALCRFYSARCILDNSQLVKKYNADGWHCTSRMLRLLKNNPIDLAHYSCSASVHDEFELELARKLGCHFILMSPVLPTATHPEKEGLGWQRFRVFCKQASMPVYALGGMSNEHLSLIKSSGGYGFASISSLWKVKGSNI